MERNKTPAQPRKPNASHALRGRGATINPVGRFERLDVEADDEHRDPEEEPSPPETQYLRDSSKSALASNDSPDVGFNDSATPTAAASTGVYCYARPTHEYFGLSAGLDFETQIFVKEDAPELLRQGSPRCAGCRRW